VIGIGHHNPLLAQDLAYSDALRFAAVPTVLREHPTSSEAWVPAGLCILEADTCVWRPVGGVDWR
jgi:hypothetical protein